MRHSRPQSSSAHDYQHKQLGRGGFEGWVPGEHKQRFYVLYIIGCALTKPISVVFRSFSELMRHKFSCYIYEIIPRAVSPFYDKCLHNNASYVKSQCFVRDIFIFGNWYQPNTCTYKPKQTILVFPEPSPNHGHSLTHVQTVISLRFIL